MAPFHRLPFTPAASSDLLLFAPVFIVGGEETVHILPHTVKETRIDESRRKSASAHA